MDPALLALSAAQSTLTSTALYEEYEDFEDDHTIPEIQRVLKKNNILPLWGNQNTMNLNPLVLENVRESYYYKNHLITLDTWQLLLDEVYYKVKHLEPWEKGTRRTQGMTGMCGGVRGVGAGGVVSSAFCLLYRFFNLRINRRQLVNMINSTESSYVRGLGFMYIRYTQPPADLWSWFETYLDDDDEVDPRSGGGDPMTFGGMVRLMLTKLDWYGTLFPRIPVPIQKEIDEKFAERNARQLKEMMRKEQRNRKEIRDKMVDSYVRKREHEKEEPEGHEKKKPKTRCAHHLRHHHCRKHRKHCPKRSAQARKSEKDEKESPSDSNEDQGPSSSSGNDHE